MIVCRMPNKLNITNRMTDEQLLNSRICDLQLSLEGSKVFDCINELKLEAELRGFRFFPHFWISDEFFTPEDIPGIALPFYLIHPRLERLEFSQMGEAEGSNDHECMRILRHELGHAVDNAYRLTRRRRRQRLFGKSSEDYPEDYSPIPFCNSYVIHLENWYAQAHPDEDFAETFAVWFKPGSRWRSQYRDWPALEKIEYMDELMNEVRHRAPLVRSKAKEHDYSRIKMTLGEHYEKKTKRYAQHSQTFELRYAL